MRFIGGMVSTPGVSAKQSIRMCRYMYIAIVGSTLAQKQ